MASQAEIAANAANSPRLYGIEQRSGDGSGRWFTRAVTFCTREGAEAEIQEMALAGCGRGRIIELRAF